MSLNINQLIEYFLAPKQKGYDVPKTVVFGLLLVAAAYGIYKLLKKLKIKIDRRLAVAVAPYVVFGSVMRVLEDLNLVSGYIFVTPGLYLFVAAITICVLALSVYAERKRGLPYFKPVFVFGLFLVSIAFGKLLPALANGNLYGALLVAAFFLPWILLFKFVKWGSENRIVTLLQMFDATATFVSLQFFGFYEQHVLPTALIDIFGPASFIIVKGVAIIAILLALDRLSEDREFNTYIKLIVGILGAATGTRDFLALVALV